MLHYPSTTDVQQGQGVQDMATKTPYSAHFSAKKFTTVSTAQVLTIRSMDYIAQK